MDFDVLWLLMGLPLAFALGWLASRLEARQWQREQRDAPRAYFKGLNLLLNEQQDKAIDAFIEAVQSDPDTSELHFALGNLFRRRGEFERAVRVHQHLLDRADLSTEDRERAQYALAQDFIKAGLFDRAESLLLSLDGTRYATEARFALLTLQERSRDWSGAIATARKLESSGAGSYAARIAHHWCEIALEADARQHPQDADAALAKARQAAPDAPRPLVLLARRHAAGGRHADAMVTWEELAARQPAHFALAAADYVASARACGREVAAADQLNRLYDRMHSLDLLRAAIELDTEADSRRQRLAVHLRRDARLDSAGALLDTWIASGDGPVDALPTELLLPVQRAIDAGIRAAQRYRCAACGFEAHQYFWQCPGCQTWDSYPPQRTSPAF